MTQVQEPQTASSLPSRPYLKIGTRVQAKIQITEGGSAEGDPDVPFLDENGHPNAEYVHAEKGELGVVEEPAAGEGAALVRFARTGTATILSDDDVVPVDDEPAEGVAARSAK